MRTVSHPTRNSPLATHGRSIDFIRNPAVFAFSELPNCFNTTDNRFYPEHPDTDRLAGAGRVPLDELSARIYHVARERPGMIHPLPINGLSTGGEADEGELSYSGVRSRRVADPFPH
jgi:hypothetical protein